MFRKMRRTDKQMLLDDAEKLLFSAKTAILSVIGDDGYPYGVPLNYVCKKQDNLITAYFHSAISGHKIDAINQNEKVSICVIGNDDIISEKYDTAFSSVMAFGKARIVSDYNERVNALKLLINKYSPEYAEGCDAYIAKYEEKSMVAVIAVELEHITGKENKG